MIPSNYHTHTRFCDGNNDPEELVLEAIRLGCKEIGFSGHSYTFYDESYCMTKDGTRDYVAAVRALQKAYEGKIKIYLGIEQDYYSDMPFDEYDYVIGSVHYVKKDGCYLPVDESRELMVENIQKFYGGDSYGLVEDYFATVADVYRKTRCQILGHFDLVKKYNGDNELFDPQHPRYRAAAQKALQALMATPVIMEINTGGMVRGCTKEPYPSADIVHQWLGAGKQVLFSSDCHDAKALLAHYDVYESVIKNA